LLFEELRDEPLKPFSVKELTKILQSGYGKNIKDSTVRRELARLAKRKLIRRIRKGTYSYVPSTDEKFVDPAKALEVAYEICKLLSKTLKCEIPDIPENREIIYRKIQEMIAELFYQSFYRLQ